MKKILVVLALTLILILVFCFMYFNSESYKINLAEKYRNEHLVYLNSISRSYIHEGVYSFKSMRSKEKAMIDQFGGLKVTPYTEYVGEGEVSLTSSKVAIALREKREELILGEPYIGFIFTSEHIEYNFPIVRWEAYTNNTCFFRYDSSQNQENRKYNRSINNPYLPPTLVLTIESEDHGNNVHAYIEVDRMNHQFASIGENKKNIKIVPLSGVGNNESDRDLINERSREERSSSFMIVPYNNGKEVELMDLKYKYESNPYPKYFKAKFEPSTYRLETYKERVNRNTKGNPFILQEK